MVMNAKKFQRPNDGHGDRNSVDEAFRVGITSPGDGHPSLKWKLKCMEKKQQAGVNGNGCRRGDVDSKLSSQGRNHSEMTSSGKKKKENDVTAQKKKAEVQRTALRVCGEWSEHVSSTGKVYYYNCGTEVSRWEKPIGWTDKSEEDSSRSKEAKKKRLMKKQNSHSAHGPNDFQDSNSASGFPSPVFSSPTFPSPTFPSPTSQGAFHLRSPQAQHTTSTFPVNDASHRTFPAVGNFQVVVNFSNVGNSPGVKSFPTRTNSVHPWQGESGYHCDAPVGDTRGRGRLWSRSIDEPGCFRRGVKSSGDGAMCEDMDISPENSPIIIEDGNSTNNSWPDRHRRTLESRPAPLSFQPGLSLSPAFSVPLSPKDVLKVNVANVLNAFHDYAKSTAEGSEAGRFSSLALSDFHRSFGLALHSVSHVVDELAAKLANQPSVNQAIEMLQSLETRFVLPHHKDQLQHLIARLKRIHNSSQNHSTTSPDIRPAVTCTDPSSAVESVEMGRRLSMQAETVAPVVSRSSENDSLGDSKVSHSVAVDVPCFAGVSCAVQPLMALTPSLASYMDSRLIQHMREWPSESIERQAKNAADMSHLMRDVQWMRVSGELKNLRSVMRTNEILATVAEQRALFLARQADDLEKGHTKFVTSCDL